MNQEPFEEYAHKRHTCHMKEEEILEMIKGWPVTDYETGITYKNLREFAEATGKVKVDES